MNQAEYDDEKIAALVSAAEQRGRTAERAAVVAWLRDEGAARARGGCGSVWDLADAIEAGEHVEGKP